jgi:hypothetical protein
VRTSEVGELFICQTSPALRVSACIPRQNEATASACFTLAYGQCCIHNIVVTARGQLPPDTIDMSEVSVPSRLHTTALQQ